MNKSDFVGFKQVFLFEFMTGIKKKGFLSFLAVLCVMGFVTMPAMMAPRMVITQNMLSSEYMFMMKQIF